MKTPTKQIGVKTNIISLLPGNNWSSQLKTGIHVNGKNEEKKCKLHWKRVCMQLVYYWIYQKTSTNNECNKLIIYITLIKENIYKQWLYIKKDTESARQNKNVY